MGSENFSDVGISGLLMILFCASLEAKGEDKSFIFFLDYFFSLLMIQQIKELELR